MFGSRCTRTAGVPGVMSARGALDSPPCSGLGFLGALHYTSVCASTMGMLGCGGGASMFGSRCTRTAGVGVLGAL